MSFAYTTDEDDSENAVSYEREGDKDGKEVWLRHVKRIDNVYDVTVASSPAYEDTEISQRELIEAHLPKAEAEQQREKEAQDKATVMRMRAKYYNTFNY
jgi:phage head maturation protease